MHLALHHDRLYVAFWRSDLQGSDRLEAAANLVEKVLESIATKYDPVLVEKPLGGR